MKPNKFLFCLISLVALFVSFLASLILPEAGTTQILASGGVAAAMLFNPQNLSAWKNIVNGYISSHKLNPENYPTEFQRLRLEVTITQNTLFRFFVKEDPNQVKNREIRLGLNNVFFGFASRFAIIEQVTATPFNAVPQTTPSIAAHNVFYETGTIRLGSGSTNVWTNQTLTQHRFNPNTTGSATTGFDGTALCYPVPVLSGRNDIQMNLEIAAPDTITHAAGTSTYILQYTFFGYNVVGLAKDVETAPLY